MTYITVKEASEKWNISTRRVCVLCKGGQIPGAVKKSKVWMIPANAKKPEDGRRAETESRVNPIVLLFNPTYFSYRNISVTAIEEKMLCEIQEKQMSGDFLGAYEDICRLINHTEDEQYLFIAYIWKMYIAADLGLRDDYVSSIQKLALFSGANKLEKLAMQLYSGFDRNQVMYELMEDELYEEIMPLLSMINAKKSINEMIQKGDDSDIVNHEIICRSIDDKAYPLISAYYHIYLAVYYNAMSEADKYGYHMKKATDILIPRKWYAPLVEYSATIDLSSFKEFDEDVYNYVTSMSKNIVENYVKVGIFNKLSVNPRMELNIDIQVGFKIIQGKSIEDISGELGISQYKVKQHIDDLYLITGASTKKEIKQLILQNFFV